MACGGLAESWIPHNFGFLLKAEIWQLLLEKRKGVQEICGMRLGCCQKNLGGQSSESAPMSVHTHPLFIKALPPALNLGQRAHGVVCSLPAGTSAGMPSLCSKDPVTPEPSLVKDECQCQESQAVPRR